MQRTFAIALALLGWFALGLQFWLSIRMSLDRGGGVAHGVWMYFAFFTILTNLVAALTLTLSLNRTRLGRFFARPDVVTAVAAYMILVSVAYNALLRGLWNPRGLQFLADLLLHDVLPALLVAYWWLTVPRASVNWRTLPVWLLYPVGYFAYLLVRGGYSGFYPYPFVNVVRLGYVSVLENGAALLLGLCLIGAFLLLVNRRAGRSVS